MGGKKVVSLAVDPGDANRLYAVSSPGTVHSSVDGGASWQDTGLTGLTVNSLSLDPANPDTLFAGTNAGIYVRPANGSWALLGLVDRTVTVLAVPAATPGRIYAGTTTGVFYSTDGGASWQPGPGELKGLSIRSLTVDPNNPICIYFGTSTQGALKVEFP